MSKREEDAEMRRLSSVNRHHVTHASNNTQIQPRATTEQLLSQHWDRRSATENKTKQIIFDSPLCAFGKKPQVWTSEKSQNKETGDSASFQSAPWNYRNNTVPNLRGTFHTVPVLAPGYGFLSTLTVSFPCGTNWFCLGDHLHIYPHYMADAAI